MNQLYSKALEGFLDGSIDWDDNVIKAALIDLDDYTPDLANNQFLADIPAAARVALSDPLGNKTKANGVADADDITFPAVTGDVCEAVVVFQDTGDPATSRLIAFFDTGAGLPVTPNGGDITVAWDSGASRIFSL